MQPRSVTGPGATWRPRRAVIVAILVTAPACLLDLGPERKFQPSGSGGGGAGPEPPGNCDGDPLIWALHLGSAGQEALRSVAPDDQGGVFVSGTFYGAIDLGGDLLQGLGFNDVFVARFDENGSHVWSFRYGDALSQPAMILVPAANGELLMAGSFTGTVDFGGGWLTADGTDAVIVRYDAQGNFLWQEPFTGPGHQAIRGAAIDATTNDIYIGGIFHESIDFGDGPITAVGEADAFVAKLDADRTPVWVNHMLGADADYAYGLAFDAASDRVLLGGCSDGDVDLGEGVLPWFGDGHGDAWAGLYDATTGNAIWTRLWQAASHQNIRSVAFDPTGTPIVAGCFEHHLVIDALSVDFLQGVFLAELDGAGVMTDIYPVGYGVDVGAIQMRPNGNVILAGTFGNTLGTGSVPISTTGKADGMIVEFDPDLAPVSTFVIGSPDNDDVSALAIASDGKAFAVANFRETIPVADCQDFTSEGDADMLLLKLAP